MNDVKGKIKMFIRKQNIFIFLIGYKRILEFIKINKVCLLKDIIKIVRFVLN